MKTIAVVLVAQVLEGRFVLVTNVPPVRNIAVKNIRIPLYFVGNEASQIASCSLTKRISFSTYISSLTLR
jgi:hypothetical protein